MGRFSPNPETVNIVNFPEIYTFFNILQNFFVPTLIFEECAAVKLLLLWQSIQQKEIHARFAHTQIAYSLGVAWWRGDGNHQNIFLTDTLKILSMQIFLLRKTRMRECVCRRDARSVQINTLYGRKFRVCLPAIYEYIFIHQWECVELQSKTYMYTYLIFHP